MKRRGTLTALALVLAMLLAGCQSAPKEAEKPTPTPAPAATEAPVNDSEFALSVRTLLARYDAEINQVSIQSPYNMDYTIPGDMLRQMASDAQQANAEAKEGRYQFIWQQSGNYAYHSTSEEALGGMAAEAPGATSDPDDETPMDSQLMGDYAVSGGGLFDRVRAYDVSETLESGKIEIVDTLNGAQTGHEAFSFALRGDSLFFVDAVLDMAVGVDSVAIQNGYLAAAGVLTPNGLDIIEYRIDDLTQLPDPAAMDINMLAQSVEIVSRLTAEGASVTAK
ncbi:MAG: hypothetical protein IKQ41_05070 [Clostridia bacterium]|nr:hypothetical protein [Clostridia bacterium]